MHLSAIKAYYPDYAALVGRHVVFVANLAPRSIMGQLSQGMLLTVENGEGVVSLLFSSSALGDGARVI